jgi:molybdenum cofactor cytidylyltransferase
MREPWLVYALIVMVDCLMLAAGSSTRMDVWKMTLPWGQATIVEHSVQIALDLCSRVIVVTGFRADELAERFRDWPRIEVVRNSDYEMGMFCSVQRGAGTLGKNPFFLALADMPSVTGAVYTGMLAWYDRFATVFAAAGTDYAVIPKHKGKKGHPLLLSPGVRTRILQTDPSKTLRHVLAEVPTVAVPVDEPGILQDIDTPADYRAGTGVKPGAAQQDAEP